MTSLTADPRPAATSAHGVRRELPVAGAWLPIAIVVAVVATIASGMLVDLRAAAGMAGTGVLVIALVAALRGTNAHGTATSRC